MPEGIDPYSRRWSIGGRRRAKVGIDMVASKRLATWRSGPGDGWRADGWHEDLVWYAAAIHQMKLLTPDLDEYVATITELSTQAQIDRLAEIAVTWSDPMSLGYQSQVHATFAAKAEWPTHDGLDAIWQACAHNQWFFLPWHRAYLVEFELVVREHIRRLGGPSETWRLPYWNSSDYRSQPGADGLPVALRGATLPDDVTVPGVEAVDGVFPNPLYNSSRALQGAPAGVANGPGHFADASVALQRAHYAVAQDTGRSSFAGGVIEDPEVPRAFHGDANERGQVDQQPHGSVHVQVNGCMALFEAAGLDPVFWMHHANVDRLWETFAATHQPHYPFTDAADPSGPQRDSWETFEFRFVRPALGPVGAQEPAQVTRWTAASVVDTRAPGLDYEYDTTAPPSLYNAPSPPAGDVDPFGLQAVDAAPEPVAAAPAPDVAGPIDLQLGGAAPGGPAAGFDGERWSLRFDGIRSQRPGLTSYEVYLGLAEDAPATSTDLAHFVGVLSLFGVYEASRDDGPGSGLVAVFDVSGHVYEQPDLDVLHPSVRLVPQDADRDLASVGLSIRRIALEVS